MTSDQRYFETIQDALSFIQENDNQSLREKAIKDYQKKVNKDNEEEKKRI